MLYQNKIKLQYFNSSLLKSKMVSFASSTMKNIFVFPVRSRFPVKLICCIAFGSRKVLVVYLNLLLPSFNIF